MTTEETGLNNTGRLEQWRYDPHYHVMWGMVFDDIRGRFHDSEWIHTSYLRCKKEDVAAFKEGDVITTRNSTYLLGKPADNPEIIKIIDEVD